MIISSKNPLFLLKWKAFEICLFCSIPHSARENSFQKFDFAITNGLSVQKRFFCGNFLASANGYNFSRRFRLFDFLAEKH